MKSYLVVLKTDLWHDNAEIRTSFPHCLEQSELPSYLEETV